MVLPATIASTFSPTSTIPTTKTPMKVSPTVVKHITITSIDVAPILVRAIQSVVGMTICRVLEYRGIE